MALFPLSLGLLPQILVYFRVGITLGFGLLDSLRARECYGRRKGHFWEGTSLPLAIELFYDSLKAPERYTAGATRKPDLLQ